jgi:hypothetical protein
MIYAALFATGSVLYGQALRGLVLLVVALVAGVVLARISRASTG